ncbi:multiheme c-type cytochrome [Tundrisphaera lichenicola]|uniref:multiheme c-type cytochrome n=1 Tax=Tundrisphaera lichenicola TaxID=2029860 RepID=UPI003EBF6098
MGEIIPKIRRVLIPMVCLASMTQAGSLAAGEPAPVWAGTGSCSATACHKGRTDPVELKGSEYEFSGAYDPHARAYQVLFEERSFLILKNLNSREDVETIEDLRNGRNIANLRPITNDLCLRCHVYQGYETNAPTTRMAGFALEDGVGCEGCHGPAGNWLVPHTESWWKGLSDEQKQAEFGFYPTKDLLSRGKVCTDCHVGDGSTEVNHDLVAAGHPRLNFEYGSQLAKLPKHWRIEDDRARHPDYESKVWVLGQIIAAQASLDLLESRAIRSLSSDETPWPEFAEYSCFSCHHELAPKSWRQSGPSLAGKPGSLEWGTWYLPMAGTLGFEGFDPDKPGSLLGDLRKEMARPMPDAALVVQRAHAASEELGRLADSINRDRIAPSETRAFLARALKVGEDGRPPDWDRAAQQYLAIVALDKALVESDPRYAEPRVRSTLQELRTGLDLPRLGARGREIFDSPYQYDPGKVTEALRTIESALPKP